MKRLLEAGMLLTLVMGCSRSIPTQKSADLPPLVVQNPSETFKNIKLGPAGREALIGEFKLSPEALGVDLSTITGDNSGLSSGVVFCAEPRDLLDDGTLVVSAGMTWWPPGAEPKSPTRSITEGLMRCLGFLEAKPWVAATVYLKPASLPRIEATMGNAINQEGTETLAEALRHGFLFGLEAVFQARGLSMSAGTQDGMVVDDDKGVRRAVEAHVHQRGTVWEHSNKILYSAGEHAAQMNLVGGTKAGTVVEGVSYVLAKGDLGALLPSAISRAGLRLRSGLGRSMITMSASMHVEKSDGLTCVLRALSPPVPVVPPPGPDGGPGEVDPKVVPGVDLVAAEKCALSAADVSGPVRTLK
jgi:hypothetical protein